MKLAICSLCLAFLLPSLTHAYFTTDQSALKVNDHTALYTITYKFGFEKRDLYMPITAVRDLSVDSDEFKLGYSLVNNGGATTSVGRITALALTDDPDVTIKDNRYFVPAGSAATFTLVAIVDLDQTEIDNHNLNLSLLVTNLPFLMVRKEDNLEILAHLNPSELQYYITPPVRF